jgi:ubiquinone/menaquinone biosynthesis C-methylase UbiE
MSFNDASFDVVIDKAVLDSISCGDGATKNVQSMLEEIHRVLTPTGCYISVSHAPEAKRVKYFKCFDKKLNKNRFNWKRTKTMVQKPAIPGPKEKKLRKP